MSIFLTWICPGPRKFGCSGVVVKRGAPQKRTTLSSSSTFADFSPLFLLPCPSDTLQLLSLPFLFLSNPPPSSPPLLKPDRTHTMCARPRSSESSYVRDPRAEPACVPPCSVVVFLRSLAFARCAGAVSSGCSWRIEMPPTRQRVRLSSARVSRFFSTGASLPAWWCCRARLVGGELPKRPKMSYNSELTNMSRPSFCSLVSRFVTCTYQWPGESFPSSYLVVPAMMFAVRTVGLTRLSSLFHFPSCSLQLVPAGCLRSRHLRCSPRSLLPGSFAASFSWPGWDSYLYPSLWPKRIWGSRAHPR